MLESKFNSTISLVLTSNLLKFRIIIFVLVVLLILTSFVIFNKLINLRFVIVIV